MHEFFEHARKEQLWQSGDKILLAVSGGVDSMVLLDLMQKAAQEDGLSLGVAHVNHQLRQESLEEAAALRQFCALCKLPFHEGIWEKAPQAGIEKAARDFRYQFFAELMTRFSYNKLLTAHHQNDQAETILMRLIRGGSLTSLQGIRLRQEFAGGKLIRPLLPFPKERLLQYAAEHKLLYFEDHTNAEMTYFRNRVRQQLLPNLMEENPQLLAHLSRLSGEIQLQDQLLTELLAPAFALLEPTDTGWMIPLRTFTQQNTPILLKKLVEQLQSRQPQLFLNYTQAEQLAALIRSGRSQWCYPLQHNWQFRRSYERLFVERTAVLPDNAAAIYTLTYDGGLFLSETEWIGLLRVGDFTRVPELTKDWQELSWPFAAGLSGTFTLRRRRSGDRIALSPQLTKKLRRYFIDEKIPLSEREKAWIIEDEQERVLAALPFLYSYLSIAEETDKIHYILIYKYRR